MEMRVFSHRDFSFVHWSFSTRRCESLCARIRIEYARSFYMDNTFFLNSVDHSTCFTSPRKIRDGIKKQRRNRGCHRLKIICIPLSMPPSSPSSIPRVPSEGLNEQIPRTNGRYGIRGRKTRVRGNGRAVGWIKSRREGERGRRNIRNNCDLR